MKARRRVSEIATAVLLLSFAGAVASLFALDRLRQRATLEEVLYIRSPKMLKRMSLGYTGLLADIYWTRAVQYFGYRHYHAASDYALLPPLLEITTELDPKLLVAYRFGANFLAPKPPEGAGAPDRAIALLEHGISHNSDNWKLYYDLGFVYYLELKDYSKAAAAFARGSKVPKAHPFLAVLAAQAAQHAGEVQTARLLWEMTLTTTKDELVRENATDHLRALRVDEDVMQLEKIIAVYAQRAGRLPAHFQELAAAGYLYRTPVDPDGTPYQLTGDGRVELRHPDDFPFVEKGLPPGYQAPEYKSRIKKQSSQ